MGKQTIFKFSQGFMNKAHNIPILARAQQNIFPFFTHLNYRLIYKTLKYLFHFISICYM